MVKTRLRKRPSPSRPTKRATKKPSFGELLQYVREREELSSTEFARKLGVSRANLWYIERRRTLITPRHAARWAKALGYDVDQFVQLSLQSLVDSAGLSLRVSVR